ncbi:MAG: antitoxin [Janthinobacterium lividum]
MADRAKLFTSGRSQAVRLPLEYRFEGNEVYIRRDLQTGDVIMSHRPQSWNGFFELVKATDTPADFMSQEDGNQGALGRYPFELDRE